MSPGGRVAGAAWKVAWVFLAMLFAAPAIPAEGRLLVAVTRAGDRLVAVGERGIAQISDDHGRTWRTVQTPAINTLTAVHFHDARLGWAVGHDAVILRTEDGGASWVRVHQRPEDFQPLLDVWFGDASRGLAVGAYGLALASVDGGLSWTPLRVRDDDMHLNALSSAGPVLFLAGEAGTLARREADGAWRELESPYHGSFFGVLALDARRVVVFGLRGHVFRSEDGGARWVQVDVGVPASILGGTRIDERSLVLVGHDGVVLISRDGGRTFSSVPGGGRRAMSGAVIAADGALVTVGEGGAVRLDLPE